MATVKLKFRRLSPSGDEGVLYLQVIHNREVRRMSTGRRIFAAEWDEGRSAIIVPRRRRPVRRRSPLCLRRWRFLSDVLTM